MRFLLAVAVVGLLAPPASGFAQQDEEGCKDHPTLSRFPGYYISACEAHDFSTHEFTVSEGSEKKVEGRHWKISYWLKDGAKGASPVQLSRNYANALASRGGARLFEDIDANGGTATMRLPAGNKNVWVEVSVSNRGEAYALTIVEEAGMDQQVEFTAMELASALREKGSVALNGILFDTGKATIKPESDALLAQVGELLKSDAALRLEIRGHTDNVGAKTANLKLSEDRAAAVKASLVKTFGIAADRLTTTGFGDARPVADNGTEEGRAKNRRVELAKQKN
jgi:outer membrane protein OmpA-like peptidoglycan-associated protein